MKIGDKVEVEITAIAHGGHSIARHDGQVIFVRHAIPGERVKVEITDMQKSFARGDCIEVISASAHRVTPHCRYSKPGGCGGCDFQHIEVAEQRRFKAGVIREQFARLAKISVEVVVERVDPVLGYRSRMEFTVSPAGRVALFKSRSNELIEIEECPIASPSIDISAINARRLPTGKRVDVAIGSDGKMEVAIEGRDNFSLVQQRVGDFEFTVGPESFWQSHIGAPRVLVDAVLDMTQAKPGDHIFDLYSGVGLFGAAFIKVIGPGGRITMIEESPAATTDARRNFANYEMVEIRAARVERALSDYARADQIILDPPRSGAGEKALAAMAKLGARGITYVACDPAALARDTSYLRDLGYQLEAIRAFDLFPMTHHVECVARFIQG